MVVGNTLAGLTMNRWKLIVFAAIVTAAAGSGQAIGQQVSVSAPFRQVNESFFERIGISWGFNAPGVNFAFNSAGLAQPPFGGYDPQAGLRTAFLVAWPGGKNAWFNIEASQGFRRSVVTETPIITLWNGQPGFFADSSVTPFVISYIPVVGGFPSVISLDPRLPPVFPETYGGFLDGDGAHQTNPGAAALRQKLAQSQQQSQIQQHDQQREQRPDQPPGQQRGQRREDDLREHSGGRTDGTPSPVRLSPTTAEPVQPSSAALPAPSVAEARKLHAQQQEAAQQEAAALVERARAAEAAGKPQLAKVYYEMAARRATGQLKQEVLQKLEAMRQK